MIVFEKLAFTALIFGCLSRWTCAVYPDNVCQSTDFPFVVRVLGKLNGNWALNASGVVISDRHVLTAKHVVDGQNPNPTSVENLAVQLGVNPPLPNSPYTGAIVPIERYGPTGQWLTNRVSSDLVILEFDEDWVQLYPGSMYLGLE